MPKRCKWCNIKNEDYITYHDKEWGKLNLEERYLFEMLILESFQAGLSWECIFYKEEKINELLTNKNIIRNKRKIIASINNAQIFKKIQKEYTSFHNYLKTFTNDKVIYEVDKTTNKLSDTISKDLMKKGMKFVGSTIIYSYLQAIGIIYSHDKDCFLYKNKGEKK